MKILVSIFTLLVCSHAYAGWTTGGTGGKVLGPQGEILLTPDDPNETLLEAAVKGSIIVRDEHGEKKLLPATYDFNKKIFTMREAATGKLLLIRELRIDTEHMPEVGTMAE